MKLKEQKYLRNIILIKFFNKKERFSKALQNISQKEFSKDIQPLNFDVQKEFKIAESYERVMQPA